MPSPKRQRQRAAREAARQAALAAQKRRARRRQIAMLVGLVGVVLLIGFLVSRGATDDEENAAATATTTTTAPPGAAPGEVCETVNPDGERTTRFDEEPEMVIDATEAYSAVVETDVGSFTIDLNAEQAPGTVNNFVFLACHQYYDGVPFQRVIQDFVVQGGDANIDSPPRGPGYTIDDELPPPGAYEIGSVAMANAGPNTGGSQFFVVVGPHGVNLPPDYSLFGHVTAGMDVVQAIAADGAEPGAGSDAPRVTHRMTNVTIVPTDGAPAGETADGEPDGEDQ